MSRAQWAYLAVLVTTACIAAFLYLGHDWRQENQTPAHPDGGPSGPAEGAVLNGHGHAELISEDDGGTGTGPVTPSGTEAVSGLAAEARALKARINPLMGVPVYNPGPNWALRMSLTEEYLLKYPTVEPHVARLLLDQIFTILLWQKEYARARGFLMSHADSVELPTWRVNEYLSKYYAHVGDKKELIAALQSVQQDAAAPELNRAQALFSQGTFLLAVKEHALARDAFQQVVSRHSDSTVPSVMSLVKQGRGRLRVIGVRSDK